MSQVKDEPPDGSIFEGEGDIELLPHEQRMMLDTIDDDVLFVTARGLGVERLFINHLIMYSDHKLLFLVLNTNQHDEAYFLSKVKESGVPCQPKLMNSEVSTKDRESIYLEGGVQFITSRILMVDLLTNRIPVNLVAGIIIYRAHQVLNSFQESFILRLYREKKKGGLVKAFSDVPTSMSSLGQLQRVMDRLYIRKIVILPRFHELVRDTLDHLGLVEWDMSLPPTLRRVQTTILDLIRVCNRELKQCSFSGKNPEEEEDDLVKTKMYAYSITSLERQLMERKSFITDKQRRLVSDLEILRGLLRIAEDMDPATLLMRLNALKSDREAVERSAGWLISPTAARLMTDVDSLCGGSNKKTFVAPPKWNVLKSILDETKALQLGDDQIGPLGPSILVVASDEIVCRQLGDVIKGGPSFAEWLARRQLSPQGREPPREPMWDPDCTSLFMRATVNAEARSELVTDLQKNQKVTARAARKRRKAAEDVMGPSEGGRQSKIVQFGILQYKRKSLEAGPSTAVEPKEEPIDEVDTEGAGDGEITQARTFADFPQAPLIITPSGEKYNTLRFLEQTKPNVVILYNSDICTIRQIELYKACNPSIHLVVHQLLYKDSTEEDRYLSAINDETLAFESIVREKGKLMISRTWDVTREDPPRLNVSTRDGGGQLADPTERPKIVVDMREFNSELPTVIYKKGFDVVAATLEVGDYVLSPGIAVERKALDDLTQSLQSGRVFKQAEQMLQHYANSVLLIETNRKLEKKIVNGGPFQGELSRHCRDIRAQLCALVRSCPKLKFIWSLSPANSAEYFGELKINHPEPDVEKAVALRGDEVTEPDTEDNTTTKSKERKPNAAMLRSLPLHLPGMASGDVKAMMVGGKVRNLCQLFTESATTLHGSIGSHVDRISILANFDFSANNDP